MKIAFLGSPEYAVPTLSALYSQVSTEITVFSQPDRPKGRGKVMQPTAVKVWALAHQLPVFTPSHKRELTEAIQALNPDLIVVIAYGVIIEKEVTDHWECINLHGSILPQYRGASPIQSSLLNQDTQTGVTVIRMNEKMDQGDMLLIQSLEISEEDDYSSLAQKLATLSAETCLQYIAKRSQLKPIPQNHDQATYCKKISTQDALLSLQESPKRWLQKIKAYSPSPGAFVQTQNGRIKILKAEWNENKLKLRVVQPEGKKPMSYEEFMRGYQKEIETPC
jgi:methionyl-tRNA formyltransferase